ncbi:MAG: MFS transporter, partial [Chitinophagales bacterium]
LDVLIADVIDEDELRTGCRREGMYFGVQGFMIRLGISVQALVTGFVLESTGYSAMAASQPVRAIAGMRLLVSGIPLAAIVVALASLYFHPLDGKRLQAVREALAAKHAKGEASR